MTRDGTTSGPGASPQVGLTIEPYGRSVVISFCGTTIASTQDALILREGSYPPVLYVPRRDVDMGLMERSRKATYCPRKGDCSYFSIAVDGMRSEDAAWSYEAPYPAALAIRDHLAFYRDRVDVIEPGGEI
jgi:uncharacterized protein (DUF427 family)